MASDKAELRQLVPAALLVALDGLAMAKDLERHVFIEKVLADVVLRAAHEHSVIQRVLGGNPYFAEAKGGRPE